ncbi:MAG: hypothetical protein N2C14_02370 [Planctomycetales bacterium]
MRDQPSPEGSQEPASILSDEQKQDAAKDPHSSEPREPAAEKSREKEALAVQSSADTESKEAEAKDKDTEDSKDAKPDSKDASTDAAEDSEQSKTSESESADSAPSQADLEESQARPSLRFRRRMSVVVRLAWVSVRGLREFVLRRGESVQSGTVSLLIHIGLILAMALWTFFERESRQPPMLLTSSRDADDGDAESLSSVRLDLPVSSAAAEELSPEDAFAELSMEQIIDPEPMSETDRAASPIGLTGPPSEVLMQGAPSLSRGGLSGRSADRRSRLLRENGGSAESELAVRRGLEWLAYHQARDGSWNFNHAAVVPHKLCLNPGKASTATGATALALLPFLGAGQTHREGEFKQVVRRGLDYLIKRKLDAPHGGDFQDGTMYAQGLVGITLCEAYAMTKDESLREPAQSAIDYIVHAQDPKGGGWRYRPRQPGDTSMLGWQLMALKSARLAYLHVPSQCFPLAGAFLDGTQNEYGARYDYQPKGGDKTPSDKATTAIGLLCRMYLGWEKNRPALGAGLGHVSNWGPAANNMYYNYYATLAMHHWGGRRWRKWNLVMRDHLIGRQLTRGPEAGSWHFAGGHGEEGGRLYNTAMAVMTLEVYYRYLPIYQTPSFEDF